MTSFLRISGAHKIFHHDKANVVFEDPPGGGGSSLDIDGFTLSTASDGIAVNARSGSLIHGSGWLTSAIRSGIIHIKINVDTGSDRGLNISSVITDTESKRVGLDISGAHSGVGSVFLTGSQSNRFSGRTSVSGEWNYLALGKTSGAFAVIGDISVTKGAVVSFLNSYQTPRTTSVIVNNASVLLYSGVAAPTANILRQLSIVGHGVVAFDHSSVFKYNKYLYLDELAIAYGARLAVVGWLEGQDFLLVRKDSKWLSGALTKMEFEGYDRNNIHLVDFNKEYWEISAAPVPEPSTYGAILGVWGLALAAGRRGRRRELLRS